jgi:hypothetical protein
MSLIFVDEEDFNPQQLNDSLTEAERLSQRLTNQANASSDINRLMAQNLASAGHRSIRPDLQYQHPEPHPPAPSFNPSDLHGMEDDKLPAFLPGTRYPMDRMRDDYIRHNPGSGVA